MIIAHTKLKHSIFLVPGHKKSSLHRISIISKVSSAGDFKDLAVLADH